MAAYPREVNHPNGTRTVTVYTPEEEREVMGEHIKFARHHALSAAASVAGERAPAALTPPETDAEEEPKRGPGRPRVVKTNNIAPDPLQYDRTESPV